MLDFIIPFWYNKNIPIWDKSYKGDRIMGKSNFDGGLLGLIGIGLLSGFLTIITLGLGAPWAVCLKERWYANHTIIDGKRLFFDGTGGQLIGNYIKWFLLTIITIGIYSFWLSIKMKKWIVKHTHVLDANSATTPII